MDLEELDFDLPGELIATGPAEPRERARLMVVRRGDAGSEPEHLFVNDLPDLLRGGDLVVFNRSRVLPARFVGVMEATGGAVEGLWLEDASGGAGLHWKVLMKARRFQPGRRVRLMGGDGTASPLSLELVARGGPEDEAGSWIVAVRHDLGVPGSTPAVLSQIGRPPLPRYILQARRAAGLPAEDAGDAGAYQTVFAEAAGGEGLTRASVAAPTAGLHFTPGLLERIAARGVERAEVTLHVGAGTFKPVETPRVEDHPMHAEWCGMDAAALAAVFAQRSGRVIAVGSTSTRTIEAFAAARAEGKGDPWMQTRLLITPGYRWRRVDGMLTNFHLPRSTLLAMVAATLEGGAARLRGLYAEAVARRYRFFSFGDAMLLLP